MAEHAGKRCTKCGSVRPVSEFGRDSKAQDGLFYWCRDCSRESGRKYREANREKLRERDRQRDRDAERERASRYREANRDAIRERERSRAREQPDGSCAVDGCDGKRRGGDFCGMHYARWKRTGDPGTAAKINLPRPDECTVDGCTTVVRAKGLCATHWSRLDRHGDPQAGAFSPAGICGVTGCDRRHAARGYCSRHYRYFLAHGTPVQPAPEPSYHGTHRMLRRLRGLASGYACQHCGGKARQWAYDHADPAERPDHRGPYSADPAHYIPLCVRCHKVMDLAAARSAP